MSFGLLALIGAIALLGPLLALPRRLGIPVVIGEVFAGLAIGGSGGIVALPLVIDPPRAGSAALGSLAVIACAVGMYAVLQYLKATGLRKKMHTVSENRRFALELRVDLVVLFALAALAVATSVSIMLAGFALGVAVAAVGEPRRLARQVFGVTDGFFGPFYFVWLGASLNLDALWAHPSMITLGVMLGVGAVVVHTAMWVTGQPPAIGALTAAQLGVPVSAVTLGTQLDLFGPAEGPAILLGALVTLAVASVVRPRDGAARA